MKYKTKADCIKRFDEAYGLNSKAACNCQDNVEDSAKELNIDYVKAFNIYFDADFKIQLGE